LAIEVLTAHWPLVLTTFPVEEVTAPELEAYIAEMEAIHRRGEKYATVVDVSRARRPLTAKLRSRVENWMEDSRDAIGTLSMGSAVVVRGMLMRGVTAALYFAKRPPNAHKVVNDRAQAIEWCVHRLQQSGVIDEDQAGELLALAKASGPALPQSPITDEDEACDPGPYSAVIELFDQPAFLLSARGVLLYRNRAAEREFPNSPDWLPQSVATGESVMEQHCRVCRVDVDHRPVYIVVPQPELLPPPEMDPRQDVALSPSLERVADLMARGMTDKEIAEVAELSLATVRTYVARIFKRLEVHSRVEFIRLWSSRDRWRSKT
jgi:DNA-binding CsgD family transcriptional regulator